MVDLDALGDSGRRLWNGVKATRKIEVPHEALLFNACRIADHLDKLAGEIGVSSLTVENSRGDEIANPLLTEHRQQLLALRQVLSALGIGALDKSSSGRVGIADRMAQQRQKREEEAERLRALGG